VFSLIRIIRSGRRRRGALRANHRQLRHWGGALVAAGALLLVAACILLSLPLSIGPALTLGEKPPPTRIYDRTGSRLIMEIASSRAPESRWVAFATGGTQSCAAAAFRAARGIPAADSLASSPFAPVLAMASAVFGSNDLAAEAAAELMKISGGGALLDRARLAGALAVRYDRRQLAEWLLNIRAYGRRAVGIDDAALTYFGVHAASLSLAQCAALEALAGSPARSADPAELRQARDDLLQRMAALGYFDAGQQRTASQEQLSLRATEPAAPPYLSSFLGRVLDRLAAQYSEDALARAGLKVVTALDLDYALQVLCAAQNGLARDAAPAPDSIAALDGSPCRLAALLGPAAGTESAADLAVAVIDPETGELLAYFDSARAGIAPAAGGRAGTALLPFAYLSAFTRGFAPASLLFDIPGADGMENLDGRFLGPLSARDSIRQRRLAATAQMMDRAGAGNISRTLDLLGLGGPAGGGNSLDALLDRPMDLLDLTSGYAILAGSGIQIIDPISAGPIVILRVEDQSGRALPDFSERVTRQVIGADLAYLLQDVLADPAGWSGYNAIALQESPSIISAAFGEAPADGGAWAFAFTSRFVVGVRAAPQDAARLTPQTPWMVAQAAAGWALRGLPVQQWQAGDGIVRREVCATSGLLPSRYCPRTESEIFLAGADPVQTDTNYRPVVINRETGRLATLWTPMNLTEQKVFFRLSGEARQWAEQSGFPLPPETYDTLPASFPARDDLQILGPGPMDILHGKVDIRGTAAIAGMEEFRVQAGPGLYPTDWYTLAESKTSIPNGILASWDTSSGDGIWSVQLLAILANGKIESVSIPVTIDNSPPEIRIVEPQGTATLIAANGSPVILQADITDNLGVAKVDFRLDGKVRTTLQAGPYSVRWEDLAVGLHTVDICAWDLAGNENCTNALEVNIQP
jgi:hypothetical protein